MALYDEPQVEPGKPKIEQLLDQLEANEQSEDEIIGAYREAAESTPDEGVRFVMSLVLEDEERHHRLASALAKNVRQSLLWAAEPQSIPNFNPSGAQRAALLAQTKRFLGVEEESARELKELAPQLKNLQGGLLELIVRGMLTDTGKHIEMLQFVKKRLEHE